MPDYCAGQALDEISRERAEWLCWIDMDIVLADPTFTFPLDKVNYTDRDIIIWGGKKQILAGDAEYGEPCSVFAACRLSTSARAVKILQGLLCS